MKLKNTSCYAILASLRALDSSPVRDQGTGRISCELSPYRFGVKARFAFAKNLKRIQSSVDEFEEFKRLLVSEAGEKPDPDKLKEIGDQVREAMESENEVEIHRVKLSDLDLTANQIPIEVLEPLIDTVIDDDGQTKNNGDGDQGKGD